MITNRCRAPSPRRVGSAAGRVTHVIPQFSNRGSSVRSLVSNKRVHIEHTTHIERPLLYAHGPQGPLHSMLHSGNGTGFRGRGPPRARPPAAAPGRRERQYDTAWTATRLRRHASEDTGPGPGIENFLGKRAPETPGHRREGNVQRALFPVHIRAALSTRATDRHEDNDQTVVV